MSVAARVAREMGVKLGNEVSPWGPEGEASLTSCPDPDRLCLQLSLTGWLQHPL